MGVVWVCISSIWKKICFKKGFNIRSKDLAGQKPYNPIPRVGHVARVLPLQLVSFVLIITMTLMMELVLLRMSVMELVLMMMAWHADKSPP